MIKSLTLTHKLFRPDGIFSELRDDQGNLLAETLEHAYEVEPGVWRPKIPNGTYQCWLGDHLLHGMTEPFETYEITGVPGHSNLLFHWGNFDQDSEGCVLVGRDLVQTPKKFWIDNSRLTFAALMKALEGRQGVTLVVCG